MPFQPGQSGNPTGAKNGSKEWAAALRIAVNEAHEMGGTKLRALANKMVEEGLAGNVNALKEIGDRLDGKVPQAVIGDKDADAIQHNHSATITIIDPRSESSAGIPAPPAAEAI